MISDYVRIYVTKGVDRNGKWATRGVINFRTAWYCEVAIEGKERRSPSTIVVRDETTR